MSLKRAIVITGLLLINTMIFSQDPHFSQFYASPLYMAPSFAGASEKTRVTLNYRDQWPKIPGLFVTYSFAADHYLNDLNSGLGVFFMRDDAGDGKISTTNVAGNYSYKLKISDRWYFQPGLKFYYHQYQLDYSKVVFNDQLGFDYTNPTSVEITEDEKVTYVDFGSSLMFYNHKYWIGGMVDHLIKANPSFQDNPNYKPLIYSLYGGLQIPLKKLNFNRSRNSLFAAFHFKSQQQIRQFNLGAYYQKEAFMVGLWYRGIPLIPKTPSNDAVILMLGYSSDNFSIGYSYDATISRLITNTGGAHEISLSYTFSGEDLFNNQEYTPPPCPQL
ncbi:MAG: PorP/SprF family type IX secretion system membrane protein [Bacteroidales bacterium]|nr:PorP/SprF family type IX secretion system membrane protein [Bacteroidales bacterium]